jgi:hypothetical protein
MVTPPPLRRLKPALNVAPPEVPIPSHARMPVTGAQRAASLARRALGTSFTRTESRALGSMVSGDQFSSAARLSGLRELRFAIRGKLVEIQAAFDAVLHFLAVRAAT